MSENGLKKDSAGSQDIYLTRKAIQNHLERLGGLSPQLLRQMLGICDQDHVHSARCDGQYSLVAHINRWLGQGIVWIRVDCPCCIRFAVPDKNEKMLWWRMPWPGDLKEVLFQPR